MNHARKSSDDSGERLVKAIPGVMHDGKKEDTKPIIDFDQTFPERPIRVVGLFLSEYTGDIRFEEIGFDLVLRLSVLQGVGMGDEVGGEFVSIRKLSENLVADHLRLERLDSISCC